jgi:hypothetical protein
MPGDSGPVVNKDGCRVGVLLDLPAADPTSSFEPEPEPVNAREGAAKGQHSTLPNDKAAPNLITVV